jgi:deoxyribonuclease-4
VDEGEVRLFREGRAAAGIRPLILHAPYLLNLASPKQDTHAASRDALAHDIALAKALGADMLVFHPGSHLGSGDAAGTSRIAQAIVEACDIARHEPPPPNEPGQGPRLLLEMVSGAGTEIGKTFEEQAEIIDRARGVALGICLDTCHIFAAGYEVRTVEGLSRVLDELEATLGASRLALVHANDSVGDLGSRLDRHADIGKGRIGEEGFRVILGCTRLADLPFVLETPRTTIDDDARNLAALRRIAAEAVRW